MVDRKDVFRQAVSESRRGFSTRDHTTPLAATGGSGRSLIDTAGLSARGNSPGRFFNHYIWRPTVAAADEIRIVKADGYNPQLTELDIADQEADWATAPTTDLYLLVQDHPDTWKAALNAALDAGVYERKTAVWTVAATDRQVNPLVAPISASWLESPTDVFDIEVQTTNTVGALQWESLDLAERGWRLHKDGGVLVLDFLTGAGPAVGEVLRLTTVRNLDMVTAHDTAIGAELDWLVWATLAKMAEWLGNPINPQDEWLQIGGRAQVRSAAKRIEELGILAHFKLRDDTRLIGGPTLTGLVRG